MSFIPRYNLGLTVLMLAFAPVSASSAPLNWMLCKGGPNGATFTDVYALEDGDRAAYAYNLTTTELLPLQNVEIQPDVDYMVWVALS